jgi:hypothetical protein
MRHKDELLPCFQNFYAYVKTQFKVQVQMLRSDNGTEYINKKFGGFVTDHGILHQKSCPDTAPQNGVAEESPHFRSGSIIDVYHECPKVPSGARQ